MSFLDDIYCIGNNEYKSMRTLINSYRELESIKSPVIDDQTIHFWNLQLQFMSMDTLDLVDLFLSLNPYFNRTKHVKKAYRKCLKLLSDYNLFGLNQDEHNCIATTLAIQLSGLE